MNERLKGILFTIILGLVLPSLVMLLSRNIHKGISGTDNDSNTQNDGVKISVVMNDGSIVQMDMNDYITSVVLCEMPANFEFQALKAQSVVARTYALRRKDGTEKHKEAAVCTESGCCQGYKSVDDYLSAGGTEENIKKIRNAVLETDGIVLTYQGDLIDATYFSCSGGMTEDAKAVWGEDIPYLQSTVSPGEEKATYYLDTVTFSVKEFAEALDLNADDFRYEGLGDITYTAGGGVDKLSVCGQAFKGTELRKKLNLRSTAFLISVVGDTVTITTKGFGHRVGMSQYGADAMAVAGAGYEEILKHYYKGVEVTEFVGH